MLKRTDIFSFFASLLLFLAIAVPLVHNPDALAQNGKNTTPDKPVTVKVTADRIIHQGGDKEVSQAMGHVEVTYQDKTVTGDRGAINHKTGAGIMEGHVRMTDKKADITGTKIRFNIKSDTGTLYNAKGDFDKKYFFTGDEIKRISEDRYKLKHGTCSTCPFGKQDWRFDAEDVDLTVEGYAFLKGMTLRAGDVPIMYLPYFIAPAKTKRATGFLVPALGYSSTNGPTIANHFFWAISDNTDATLTHEYMGQKGNKLGLEYRYILSEKTRGAFNAEYLKETDPDKPESRDFWKVLFDHNQLLPMGVTNVTHVDRESENSIAREYGDNVTDRTRRYTYSYTRFQKNWTTRTALFQAQARQSTVPGRDEEFNTLPTISFVNQKQKLWKTPLYGALDTSFTAFRTNLNTGSGDQPYDVDRFDVYPTLSIPISVAPWLSLTPQAGYRYTYYSGGEQDGQPVNESFSREYYTAGLDIAGPKFFRIFETSSRKTPKIKHLIVPTVSWSYLPGYEYDGPDRQKVKTLDGIDTSTPRNTITYQLANHLLVKEIPANGTPRVTDRAIFNISQSYDINEADRTDNPETGKRPLSPILFDLDTKPFDWLMLNYDTTWNVYDRIWDTSHIEIGLRYEDTFHFALDRNYTYPDVAWDTAYLEVNLPWRWSVDYSIIYDEQKGESHDSLLRARYNAGCWGMTFNWYQRKINTTDSAGSAIVADESKFLFMITLNGVGDIFGETLKPLVGRKIR